MTISFRAVSTAGVATSAYNQKSLTITKPAATADGDFLIACIASTQQPSATLPAGWTLRQQNVASYNSTNSRKNLLYISLYTKVASGEPASWAWTWITATDVASGFVASYIGSANGLDVKVQKTSTDFTTAFTSPGGVTANFGNEMILRIGAFSILEIAANLPTSVAQLSGYTRRVNQNNKYNSGYINNGFYGRSIVLTYDELFSEDVPTLTNTTFAVNKKARTGEMITVTIASGNSPPVVSNIAPYDNYKYNLAGTPTFSWTSADPDNFDVQSAFAIKRKIGAGAYEWYTVGTGLWGAVEVFNTSSVPWFTFPAAKWATGSTYLWSVAVKDQFGAASNYSTDTTVIATASPPTVAVTKPEAPYRSFAPIVEWTNTAGTQGPVRVKVYDLITTQGTNFNPDQTAPLWDSGLSIASPSLTTGIPLEALLQQGPTYVAYVLATDGTTAANPFAPNTWASKSFSIDIDESAPPTILTATTATATTGPRVTLAVRNLHNLLTLDQSASLFGVSEWKALTNSSLAWSSVGADSGAVQMTATAAATMTACTSEGRDGIPVLGGQSYKAYASNFASATRTCRVGIRWYDASGNLISTSFGSNTSCTIATTVQISPVTASAPTNAVYAAVVVEVQSPLNTEQHFITHSFLGSGSASNNFVHGGRVYGNLLSYDDSTFENSYDSVTNWANPDSNLTLARVATNPRSGSLSLKGTAEQGGNSVTPPTGAGEVVSPQVDVYEEQQYTASVWIRPSAARNFTCSIDWYKDDGETLISSTVGLQTALTSGSYQQIFVFAKAPVDAKQAAIRVTFENPTLADTFNLDDATLTQGWTTHTSPGGLTIPTLIELWYSDDTINFDKVRDIGSALSGVDLSDTINDYEVPVGTTRTYKARERSLDEDFDTMSAFFSGVSGAAATTPDSAILSILADFDIRVWCAADDWTPASTQTLTAKFETTGNQRSWRLNLLAAGTLELTISGNGTTTTTFTSSANLSALLQGVDQWIRVTYQADDGTATARARFFTSNDGIVWTQLGTDVTSAGAKPIFDSTASFTIGAEGNAGTVTPFFGYVHYLELRNGVAGGIIAQFDPSQASQKSQQYTDVYGIVYTLSGQTAWVPALNDLLVTFWSPTITAVGPTDGQWWLKDPLDPTRNMALFIDGGSNAGIDFKSSTTNAKFDIMGRPDWVVIEDTYKYEEIKFSSLLFATDFATFEVMRKSGRVLLLQSDYGAQYYVKFDNRDKTLLNTNAEFQEIKVDLIQVARVPA